MSGTVYWYSSDNFGAPQIENIWGSIINVLQGCLIDGYGDQDIASLKVMDGVGVATFSAAHNFQLFQWIEISGATEAILNNRFKIVGTTETKIEFLVDLPDQVVTDSLSCRIPPLGWTKVFEETNKGVYQARNTERNPYFLRVDNTMDPLHVNSRAKFAKVGILETCVDINDISGKQAPFNSDAPTRNWVGTGTAAAASATIGWARWVYATKDTNGSYFGLYESAAGGIRSWILVGDDDSFYLMPTALPVTVTNNYAGYSICCGFGVTEEYALPFLLCRHDITTMGTTTTAGDNFSLSANTGYMFMLKNRDGTYINGSTSADAGVQLRYGLNTGAQSGGSNIFTKVEEDGLYHVPFVVADKKSNYCGTLPLIRNILNAVVTSDPPTVVHTDSNRAYVRRKMLGQTLKQCAVMFDLGEL